MNMNGGTSTSATDPHHRANVGYLGMGLPGMDNLTPMTPPTGNGFAGAGMTGVGLMPGSPVGPDLKHHADFLSRLLAATPSYPNDVGNPPPGFFSDWLRRLVSKPGPGNGNHHHHHQQQHSHRPGGRTSPPRISSPSGPTTPNSIQQTTSSMTFSPNSGQVSELKRMSPLESTSSHQPSSNGTGNPPTNTQPLKRRKRTRISDHHLQLPQQHPGAHHSGKNGGSNVRESPSPLASHLNHNQNSLVSSALTSNLSGSSSSSAAAVAAAASLNPFTHPLWFFPPFLPNPYLNPMNMNMGMNLPGLLPPHVPQPPPGSATTSPYGIGLPTSENLLSSSFRSSADTLLHSHHAHHRPFNSPPEMNLNTKKQETEVVGSGGGKGITAKRSGGTKASKKSSSFSISRLTSPSPSSNSSGGSLTSKGSNHNNNNYSQHHGMGGVEQSNGKTASLALGGTGEMMMMTPTSASSGRMSSGVVKSGGGGNKGPSSESGSETGGTMSTNCVDLRVSGRSWEKSGVSAPPPRSIYKPLSAFHDPAELNLTHSSTPHQHILQGSSLDTFVPSRPTGQQRQDEISGDSRSLSTTYVLKNLHHIYLRVKESSSDSHTSTINNNIESQPSLLNTGSIPFKNQQYPNTSPPQSHGGGGAPGRKSAHPTHLRPSNYLPSAVDLDNDTISSRMLEHEESSKKKVIDLSESRSGGVKKKDLKIPLARPIKTELNYKSNGSGDLSGKRFHSSLNSLSSSSNLSFDEDEDDEPVELRPKTYKYSRTSGTESKDSDIQYNDTDKDVEEGGCGGSDFVNVLSETDEPDDEAAKSDSSGEDEERKRIRNTRDSRNFRKTSSTSPGGILD